MVNISALSLQLCCLLSRLSYASPSYRTCLTVSTTNGLVTGHLAANGSEVIEYLGIPYAQPPVGDLRFAPAQPYIGNTPFEASSYGHDCPQVSSPPSKYPDLTPQAQTIINYFSSGWGQPQGEDCLTINIWSKPSRAWHKASKPVLMFFYGGRFATGFTNTPLSSGQYLADAEDVVVITFNYRINVFGFPGAPNVATNLGLLDQRLAIEWVRDNIAAFGGDPSKITIFGQSAGGVAIDYYSYAYKDNPIVHGLIMESGNAFSFPIIDPEDAVTNWYNLSALVGCGKTGDTLACMRQVDWELIENATAKVRQAPSNSPYRSVPAFYPIADGKLVFDDYLTRSSAGEFAKIPLLITNNANEQGYYALGAYARNVTPTYEQGQDFLLSSFVCPASQTASDRAFNDVPVWRGYYYGDWDNLRLYPDIGTYHGSELPMIFGTAEDISGDASSEAENQISVLFQRAWAAFAADPVKGLSDQLGWPQFNNVSGSVVQIALNNSIQPQLASPEFIDAACSTVELAALATSSS